MIEFDLRAANRNSKFTSFGPTQKTFLHKCRRDNVLALLFCKFPNALLVAFA